MELNQREFFWCDDCEQLFEDGQQSPCEPAASECCPICGGAMSHSMTLIEHVA